MIREAIEYIAGLVKRSEGQLLQVGDQQFHTYEELKLIRELVPQAINVRSLSGLVGYIKSEFDGDHKLMVHVMNPTKVVAFTEFNRDKARNFMIEAAAMLPDFKFDSWYRNEEFNISLQSGFIPTDDRAAILRVIGTIQEENVKTTGDNGVTQTVVAKSGIATVGNVIVPNPVVLRPFRTFVEVDQPMSEFVFRMKDGPSCALFEADGGAWKLAAMENINAYLQKALQKEVESGKIVIIA